MHLFCCQRMPNLRTWGLGQDPPVGTSQLIITLQKMVLCKQRKLFPLCFVIMSFIFSSFLGFLSVPSWLTQWGKEMKSPETTNVYPNRKTCQVPCANVPGYRTPAATGNLNTSLEQETLLLRTTKWSLQAISNIWAKGLGQHGKQICTKHV